VLPLPGYTGSWRSFLPLLRELPSTVRAIAVSLRRHHCSSKQEAGHGTAAMAGNISALMSQREHRLDA
jgi:hypothetical protein